MVGSLNQELGISVRKEEQEEKANTKHSITPLTTAIIWQ